MAIRDRLRKTFKRNKDNSSSGGSTPSTSSDPDHYTGRTDIEYYKPHEIPKSKYKGKVDPNHQKSLDAYSFADAFSTVRRRSSQALSGIMSPGGTKSQSRRASYMSHMSKASNDRGKSVSSAAGLPGGQHPLSRQVTASERRPATLIKENSEDDTDVFNGEISMILRTCHSLTTFVAGVSRRATARPQDLETLTNTNVPKVRLERQATVQDQPFTAAELEQAMAAARIPSNGNGMLSNNMPIPAH